MMQNSSNSANTRDDDEENTSTVKEKGSRPTKVSPSKLCFRRIYIEEEKPDKKMEHLTSIIKTTRSEPSSSEARDLLFIAQELLDEARKNLDAGCLHFLDNFSFNFDKAKSRFNFPVVNDKYFKSDLARCRIGNEAILQRTVMIHIIDHHWLPEIFTWNSEGQWFQSVDTRLPSSRIDVISSPKPDLAIFFSKKSFTGKDIDDPIPSELDRCISPDGGNRCFPFLFMEAKKAGSDLQEAYTANLHSASQALYNIYAWMIRVNREDDFFNDVRVFSLVLNAQDLSVRVHRAEKQDDKLFFHFAEFHSLQRYTKDQACLLIRTTVIGYAEKELHPILRSTFKELTKQETEQISAKRKANFQGQSSEKRIRRQQRLLPQTFAMTELSSN